MPDGTEGTSPRLDRVAKPDPCAARTRDHQGKEALYSTAPGQAPAFPVVLACNRCEVERGLTLPETLSTLRPPVLFNPLNRKLWGRCPTCQRRAWLRLRLGQSLRVLLDRAPRT
jgi:hypothetical protein